MGRGGTSKMAAPRDLCLRIWTRRCLVVVMRPETSEHPCCLMHTCRAHLCNIRCINKNMLISTLHQELKTQRWTQQSLVKKREGKKKETKCHVVCNKKRDTLNRGHDRVMTGDFCGRCHRKFQSGNEIWPGSWNTMKRSPYLLGFKMNLNKERKRRQVGSERGRREGEGSSWENRNYTGCFN